ncbi:MAG: hypothetical protein LUQ65_05195 [Candidatus Helarchaeota archaeon]|nr:hypothetical protein [Candidatus Helarchaeota archaeon]
MTSLRRIDIFRKMLQFIIYTTGQPLNLCVEISSSMAKQNSIRFTTAKPTSAAGSSEISRFILLGLKQLAYSRQISPAVITVLSIYGGFGPIPDSRDINYSFICQNTTANSLITPVGYQLHKLIFSCIVLTSLSGISHPIKKILQNSISDNSISKNYGKVNNHLAFHQLGL